VVFENKLRAFRDGLARRRRTRDLDESRHTGIAGTMNPGAGAVRDASYYRNLAKRSNTARELASVQLQQINAARAEVAHIGGGWGVAGNHATADDRSYHPPLPEAPAAPPPQPMPVGPSEAELRVELGQASEAKRQAVTVQIAAERRGAGRSP
jgi:hypothetical protein